MPSKMDLYISDYMEDESPYYPDMANDSAQALGRIANDSSFDYLTRTIAMGFIHLGNHLKILASRSRG